MEGSKKQDFWPKSKSILFCESNERLRLFNRECLFLWAFAVALELQQKPREKDALF